jgi:curli biogenesis system outer membrane secretion channel CsgG
MQGNGLTARWAGAGLLAAMIALGGCASVGETGQRDQATADVGNYSPAPGGVEKPRVGVPPFSVKGQSQQVQVSKPRLQNMAADQMTTLLFQTDRFNVIERAQLEQLLREQDMEGIVKPGEMAARGQVRGVDYLLLGKITGFRVKVDRTSQEAGVRQGWVADQLEGITGGFSKNKTRISTELGVDIRLVDPSSGQVHVAHFSDYKRVDSAESMGLDIAGVGASGDADVRIKEDDAGKVLRLAFDDALKKAMSQIDQMLRNRHGGGSNMAGNNQGQVQQTSGSSGSSSGGSFCPNCGHKVTNQGAKFCPECGQSL